MLLGNILLLIALIFFVGAVIFGFISKDSWKNTGITWGITLSRDIFIISIINNIVAGCQCYLKNSI